MYSLTLTFTSKSLFGLSILTLDYHMGLLPVHRY
jgi:hypothetical protein